MNTPPFGHSITEQMVNPHIYFLVAIQSITDFNIVWEINRSPAEIHCCIPPFMCTSPGLDKQYQTEVASHGVGIILTILPGRYYPSFTDEEISES